MRHKYHSKSKMRDFILPNPDTPGIGPDSPNLEARSLRMSDSVRKLGLPRVFGIYPKSPGNLRPTAIFWVRGINTPSSPSADPLLPIWRAELIPKLRKALSLSFLHSWVIPLRDLSEKQARARICASEPHSHLLSTWFWSSPRIQVCYSWSLVHLDG